MGGICRDLGGDAAGGISQSGVGLEWIEWKISLSIFGVLVLELRVFKLSVRVVRMATQILDIKKDRAIRLVGEVLCFPGQTPC
jgi:hypothetical protein